MSRSFTLAGQYGTIPDDEYLRKIEETNLPEFGHNQDMYQSGLDDYELYIRKQLVDFRPDAPFLESDQIRDPNDRGSGFGSRERLSIRHAGARSEELPDLPDGTFLDHEFMEKDPRGVQNLPDFRQNVKQQYARRNLIKFSNDESFSVPETGINPVQMNALIRGNQHELKDRMQIFDESMDGWAHGSSNIRGSTSTAMVTKDGTVVNLADAEYTMRRDPTNVLSNKLKGTPRLTTPDQRVKVSKYGQIKPLLNIGANKWNTNRNNSYLDHTIPINVEGTQTNRMMARLILDLEEQRAAKQMVAQGASYSESELTQIRDSRKNLNPDDIYKLIKLGLSSTSQVQSAHTLNYSDGMDNKKSLDIASSNLMNTRKAVQTNHHIAQVMVQSNRKLGPTESKDLREAVIEAGVHYQLEGENKTRNLETKMKNTLTWEGLDNRYIEESKDTKIYKTVAPLITFSNFDKLNWEAYKTESKELSPTYKNTNKSRGIKVTDVVNDADMYEFNLPERKHQVDHRDHMTRVYTDTGDMDFTELKAENNMTDVITNIMNGTL